MSRWDPECDRERDPGLEEPAAEGAEEQIAPQAWVPYWVTPHIDVRPQEDGSIAFFFRRSLGLGLAIALAVAALGFGLAGSLAWLAGAGGGWVTFCVVVVLLIAVASAALLRTTGVIAQEGRLLMRTEWLPWIGSERAIPSDDIEAIQRHVSLRLGRNSIYQIRAHLRSGEIVPVGHGVSDKVEAASLAAAMESACVLRITPSGDARPADASECRRTSDSGH